MKRQCHIPLDLSTATILLAMSFCGCASRYSHDSAEERHPVVSVEQTADMFDIRSKKTGRLITVGLEVFSDGKCNIRTFRGDEFTKVIGRSKVEGLLRWLEREGLFSISDDLIERRIRETSPYSRVIVVDSGFTRLAARRDTQTVKLSRYALAAEIEYYTQVPELQTIQKCIEHVYEIVGTE